MLLEIAHREYAVSSAHVNILLSKNYVAVEIDVRHLDILSSNLIIMYLGSFLYLGTSFLISL